MNQLSLFTALVLLAAGMLLSPAEGQAQSFGVPGSFTRIGISPRGMSMGNAMSASTTGETPAIYNPALSALDSGYRHLDLSTAALKYDRNLHSLSLRLPMPPTAGLSLHLINAKVGKIDGRNSSGYHTGMLSTNEFKLAGQFGIRLTDHLYAGIGISWFLANYHTEVPNATSVGLDFGILVTAHERLRLAVTVRDLLAGYDLDTSGLYSTESRQGGIARFPLRYITGFSLAIAEELSLNGEVELRSSSLSKMSGGTALNADTREAFSGKVWRSYFRMGTEYHLHERFTIRGGLQINEPGFANSIQPAGGFSVHLPYDKYAPSVDYAFVREPSGISSMHVFALRFRL